MGIMAEACDESALSKPTDVIDVQLRDKERNLYPAGGSGGPNFDFHARPAKLDSPGSRPNLRDGGGSFVRVSALYAAGINRSGHIEICLARQN
jgi:hypothetical protein